MNATIEGALLNATIKTIDAEDRLHILFKDRDMLAYMLDSSEDEFEEEQWIKLLIRNYSLILKHVKFINELEYITCGYTKEHKYSLN